jgi:hypothetical protein
VFQSGVFHRVPLGFGTNCIATPSKWVELFGLLP